MTQKIILKFKFYGFFTLIYLFFIDSFIYQVHVVPLPPTTHIDLPPIKVEGHYLEIHQASMIPNDYSTNASAGQSSGNPSRSHGYLSVSVQIGSLEQNLTTDLLNHMIFFQKGFVKVCVVVLISYIYFRKVNPLIEWICTGCLGSKADT